MTLKKNISTNNTALFALVNTLKPKLDSLYSGTMVLDFNAQVGVNEAANGFYAKTTGIITALSVYRSKKFPISQGITYYASGITSGTSMALAVYFDATGVFISSQTTGTSTDTTYFRLPLTVPANAAYVGLSTKQTTYPILETYDLHAVKTKWENKKIAWYGTSIPAGSPQTDKAIWSYANRSVLMAGGIINNQAVSNMIIRKYKSDGSATTRTANSSFTNTDGNHDYVETMINLIGTINEPDLFIFDFGVNDVGEDATDINAGN